MILVLVAIAAASPFLLARGKGNDLVQWRGDFEAAKAEAKSTGRLLLIDFTADWCGPCRTMKRETFSSDRVAKALESYVPVMVDLSSRTGPGTVVASQFGVSAIPTLMIVDADGNVLRKQVGGMGPDLFLEWLAEKK